MRVLRELEVESRPCRGPLGLCRSHYRDLVTFELVLPRANAARVYAATVRGRPE